jgi:chromosome partitioning protein
MRRIALINQKGGVGKTTTAVNLGAALARAGRRVVLVDLDPQANLSLHLDRPAEGGEPSTYSVLTGATRFGESLQDTTTPGLRLLPSHIDLSGAELELANAYGRELLLREAIEGWEAEARAADGRAPADYVLIDCPPSLGLLSVNGLVAAREVVIAVQTEFFALQGMSKLVDVLGVLRRRLNPQLETCGILACLYDSRLKLAREVLAEIRRYFPGQVFARAIAKNIKLAEAPSYGQTIFEYAPASPGASDYAEVAGEILAQEAERDPGLARPADAQPPEDPAPAPTREPQPAKSAPKPPATRRARARRAAGERSAGRSVARSETSAPEAVRVEEARDGSARAEREQGAARQAGEEERDEREVTLQPEARREQPPRSPAPRVVGDISLD